VLRLLLAFCVVISHSQPIFGYLGMGGGNAVPAFFIISGFYMHLVLATKYQGTKNVWLFYSNRFLRLFPSYWVVLLIVVGISMLPSFSNPFVDRVQYLCQNAVGRATDGNAASIAAAIPNLLMVGSDIVRLFAIDLPANTLSILSQDGKITDTFRDLSDYLILPPIWSVGVELVFYALAPLAVLLRTRFLVGLFIGFILVQFGIAYNVDMAWRHLPSAYNISYFILGMLSFRFSGQVERLPSWAIKALACMPFVICLVPFDFILEGISKLLLWVVWLLYSSALPALFTLTRKWAWDRRAGDFSYPIYLCHWLFAWPAAAGWGNFGAPIAFIFSFVLAWVIVRLVDDPIETFRQERVGQVRVKFLAVPAV